jgi:hypothetical protein
LFKNCYAINNSPKGCGFHIEYECWLNNVVYENCQSINNIIGYMIHKSVIYKNCKSINNYINFAYGTNLNRIIDIDSYNKIFGENSPDKTNQAFTDIKKYESLPIKKYLSVDESKKDEAN